MKLVCAIDATNEGDHDDATEVAAAERAINNVITEIESTGKPVKIEADIVHSHPAAALLEASQSAAMICVGSTGVKHATQRRTGSTAAALAVAAHCPVAVAPTSTAPRQAGLILAAVDESPASSAVLELAVQEARLRRRRCALSQCSAGKSVATTMAARRPNEVIGSKHKSITVSPIGAETIRTSTSSRCTTTSACSTI